MKDLFGNEMSPELQPTKGLIQKKKAILKYRKATFDFWRTCKTCARLYKRTTGDKSVNRYKCQYIGLSNCATTDIRLSCVCDSWEERLK